MIFEHLTDSRDRVIFGETPVLLQPRFGDPLPSPDNSRHRFVCGAQGLFIEAQNDVISARIPVAESYLKLPYGEVGLCGIQLRYGKIPANLLALAQDKARAAVPNEWAGYIVWDRKSNQYDLFEPSVLSTSPGQISYLSSIPENLVVVMDLHSHGGLPAFFSSEDDFSDRGGGFYIAGVIGNCHTDEPTVASRMVINGHFLPSPDFRDFFEQI
jgi:PRTRC genetic system protein A